MKNVLWLLLLGCGTYAYTQTPARNVIIVTTDGVRWQEIFSGADSALLHSSSFVQNIPLTRQLYWERTAEERRKRLMPFLWNVLAKEGRLYGNRNKGSKVNVRNPYKISYPGYNELLTGYADPLPLLNKPQYNRNVSVLEYLSNQPGFADSVVAFTSWNVFPFILNNKRSQFLQNSGYTPLRDSAESIGVNNAVQESLPVKYKTRYDLLTFFAAKEYISHHHPRVVFLGLGETDEFAHHGQYDRYLQQLTNVDRMLSELWYLIQTDPFYKDNTVLLFSTDHGRGKGEKWTSHHTFISGSGQIWMAMLGKNVAPDGEIEMTATLTQGQLAATVGSLLGVPFRPTHSVAKPISLSPVKLQPVAEESLAGAPR